ncbi:MAG: 3-deoxy-8-phosphooctulonate synthase [Alphaproteobacteria bacterium GM202ARS2]|nr:3-deoxy-8-phosphooctulonate synthase [Alphaproteobacteria bacterium GM202ARS2]
MTARSPWHIPAHKQRTVTLNKKVRLNNQEPLAFIGGPCALESLDHARMLADELCRLTDKHNVGFIFKGSFDKANRSKSTSPRGIGIDEGLKILAAIRQEYGCPVLTDVHEAAQCVPVAQAVDILQIPAFLCRQTDLLHAAAATKKAINIKKGQFMAPWDIAHVIDKVAQQGNSTILITERGSSFGYNTLVNDMRALPFMVRMGYPVVFDATHSVQSPGGRQGEGQSGGERDAIEPLARAAVAVGVACLFAEVHQDPDNAPSDGANMLNLKTIDTLLAHVTAIDSLVKKDLSCIK